MNAQDQMKYLKNTLMNAYKESVPSNARMLLKTFTNPGVITENNFTKKELDALRDAAYNAKIRKSDKIGYDDYPYTEIPKDPYSDVEVIKQSLLNKNKGYTTANTIGRAKMYESPKGNTHIADRYDFAPVSHDPEIASGWGEIYKQLHALAEEKGTPMPVDINLGNMKNFK